MTSSRALSWTRSAWEADWKPTATENQGCGQAVVTAKPKKKGVVTLSDFLGDSDEDDDPVIPLATDTTTSSDATVPEEYDLTKYLRLPVESADCDVWWKYNRKHFPHLAKMAREFLATPASTAGVERIFSACGHMHSDLRKSTSEQTLQHSLMAAINTLP
ncbi:hypothetical protein CYMTET_21601 [Cymbomonas tetramitiformis]|uniref:HAT C-terminal dimerisation domain-containing protein n=1 Tax=Cymbomonas tetramitiformis TaxID=36881 RepID=A0AAE0G1V8_9CHLO|nr:hypothetical protein CYMTET_21601 [Cymbomonas tetramitiformis]